MKSKIQTVMMLATVVVAFSNVGAARSSVTKVISNDSHRPPASASQLGGIPPVCPTGYTCAK